MKKQSIPSVCWARVRGDNLLRRSKVESRSEPGQGNAGYSEPLQTARAITTQPRLGTYCVQRKAAQREHLRNTTNLPERGPLLFSKPCPLPFSGHCLLTSRAAPPPSHTVTIGTTSFLPLDRTPLATVDWTRGEHLTEAGPIRDSDPGDLGRLGSRE